MSRFSPFFAPASVLSIAVFLAACGEEKRVAQYDTPKEARPDANDFTTGNTTPPAPGAPTMTPNAGLLEQTAGFAKPEWSAPVAWVAQPENPMRKGSWKTGAAGTEAEISVTVFPGDVGGLAANVGRWCGQVGLPAPESPEALAKLTKPSTVAGLAATRVALVNEGKSLTAVTLQKDGATWFFKISGPEGSVAAASQDFDAFLASVKFPSAK